MGLSSSKPFDPIADLPDLKGRVVIVTGGNSGIGFATVQQLARKGAKVYLAARNESKATGAIARLEAEGLGPGNGEIVWLKLDLSDPKATKAAADVFLSKEKRLDILINNAAMLASPYSMNAIGVQETIVVNYLSPFVFTQTLLPCLYRTAAEPGTDVRIVNVSSHAHALAPAGARFRSKEDLNISYDAKFLASMKRYGVSKLAVILWTDELQRRIDVDKVPIICLTLHPGGVFTEGNISAVKKYPASRITLYLTSLVLYTPTQGAYTVTFAAASSKVRTEATIYKGAFLMPMGKMGKKTKMAEDAELGKELWTTSESLSQEIGLELSAPTDAR
ncbi:NAD-P-binding protein [Rickenella mellea]|uniref:NAD-P-binding protein n=1 Tax=Rickenella mellea TaxID=50990 RepID=A0A4V3AZG2_9AGAM|nr:NAD-P-binding protein [Rickenella mellea]